MPTKLGLDTTPDMPPAKPKRRWNKAMTIFVGVVVVFFLWVVVSNLFLLYFGRPLIPH